MPKQMLPLATDASLFQETVRRVSDAERFEAPLIICNQAHRFVIAEQMRELDIEPRAIVLEPEGRNTAPALAIAAMMMEDFSDTPLFVMPSDHAIEDFKKMLPAIDQAVDAATQGVLVTFGLFPKAPEIGYGYVQRGNSLRSVPGVFEVSRFIEKPDRATAESLISSGDWFWNSGMFLFSAKSYLAEHERFQPEIVIAAQAALSNKKQDLDFLRLDETAFLASPAISIDYAVMERTKYAAVVPTNIIWNDLGSWSALFDIAEKDANGNVLQGDVVLRDVKNSYIRSETDLVAAIGLNEMIVVATEDVILVAPKGRAQDVKILVDDLKSQGRNEVLEHRTVYRPWGHYRTVQAGPRFQVKQITVKPGAKLSLQMHHHRAEHWVVVTGTARVVRGEETLVLTENESAYIPLGTKHRLENPGKVPLDLIEVQSGGYLGEDDIIRFDDEYGRGN